MQTKFIAVKQPEGGGSVSYQPDTKKDSVNVPWWIAAITGLLWGLAAAVAVILLALLINPFFEKLEGVGWFSAWFSWWLPPTWLVSMTAFCGAFFRAAIPAWYKESREWKTAVIHAMLRDLNGNGIADALEVKNPALEVTHKDQKGNILGVDEIPYADRLGVVAESILSGAADFTHDTWAGKVGSGKLFRPEEWSDLMHKLEEHNYIQRKTPGAKNSSFELTGKGVTAFQDIVNERARIERESKVQRIPTVARSFASDTPTLPPQKPRRV